jgi:hypothetical protein
MGNVLLWLQECAWIKQVDDRSGAFMRYTYWKIGVIGLSVLGVLGVWTSDAFLSKRTRQQMQRHAKVLGHQAPKAKSLMRARRKIGSFDLPKPMPNGELSLGIPHGEKVGKKLGTLGAKSSRFLRDGVGIISGSRSALTAKKLSGLHHSDHATDSTKHVHFRPEQEATLRHHDRETYTPGQVKKRALFNANKTVFSRNDASETRAPSDNVKLIPKRKTYTRQKPDARKTKAIPIQAAKGPLTPVLDFSHGGDGLGDYGARVDPDYAHPHNPDPNAIVLPWVYLVNPGTASDWVAKNGLTALSPYTNQGGVMSSVIRGAKNEWVMEAYTPNIGPSGDLLFPRDVSASVPSAYAQAPWAQSLGPVMENTGQSSWKIDLARPTCCFGVGVRQLLGPFPIILQVDVLGQSERIIVPSLQELKDKGMYREKDTSFGMLIVMLPRAFSKIVISAFVADPQTLTYRGQPDKPVGVGGAFFVQNQPRPLPRHAKKALHSVSLAALGAQDEEFQGNLGAGFDNVPLPPVTEGLRTVAQNLGGSYIPLPPVSPDPCARGMNQRSPYEIYAPGNLR